MYIGKQNKYMFILTLKESNKEKHIFFLNTEQKIFFSFFFLDFIKIFRKPKKQKRRLNEPSSESE